MDYAPAPPTPEAVDGPGGRCLLTTPSYISRASYFKGFFRSRGVRN